MRTAKLLLASVFAIAACAPAVAQQSGEGTITSINRLNGTIAIQQNATVGASATAVAEQFKVQDAALLEAVHAGDSVTYSVSESGGTKTITKLQRQKN
jgi:Cu/Ag efflux protein CusF